MVMFKAGAQVMLVKVGPLFEKHLIQLDSSHYRILSKVSL